MLFTYIYICVCSLFCYLIYILCLCSLKQNSMRVTYVLSIMDFSQSFWEVKMRTWHESDRTNCKVSDFFEKTQLSKVPEQCSKLPLGLYAERCVRPTCGWQVVFLQLFWRSRKPKRQEIISVGGGKSLVKMFGGPKWAYKKKNYMVVVGTFS